MTVAPISLLLSVVVVQSRDHLTLDWGHVDRLEGYTSSAIVRRLAATGPQAWRPADLAALNGEVARSPNDYALRAARAQVALRLGRAADLERRLGYRGEPGFGSRPDRYEMGLLAMAQGRDDDARNLQDTALLNEPNFFECMATANRGVELNMPQNARRFLRRALKLRPDDYGASLTLAMSYLCGGMPGVGQALPPDYVPNPAASLNLCKSLLKRYRTKYLTLCTACAMTFLERKDDAIDLYRQYLADPDEGEIGRRRVRVAKNNLALLLMRK